MALTTMDAKPALIVVDLQRGLVGYPTVHPIEEVIERSARLATAFRRHDLPVVLVNATGGAPGRTEIPSRVGANPPPDWAEIVDELDPHADDLRITKQRWGAFLGTSLDTDLRELGVTQVVLVGVATSVGVESTARSAHEHGYHVVLPIDAMTDTNPDAHHNSVERIFPKLGETTTSIAVLEMLESSRT